jgi:uncharacterized Zn-binding protein involved in type VI secretion
MARKIIVLGDPTSHGGKVISGSAVRTIGGKAIARKGDKVDCPAKYPNGSPHGVNEIIEGEANMPIDGIPVALEGHKTVCGCALIGTSNATYGGDGASANDSPTTAPEKNVSAARPAYSLHVAEKDALGPSKYVNASGNTECVEFVRQAAGAAQTTKWKQGARVADLKPGDIPRGAAIATFDANGHYPTDTKGKHAAIYLSHDEKGVRVLDQWRAQGEVRERVIRFKQPKGTSRSNDGDAFYIIE